MYPDSRAKEAWLYYVEPATPHSREPRAVKEWTLLDPCCGSGHFLVVAFDLLVHLYAEERALAEQGLIPADWAVPEAEVARTILERNLHGIDIDPRAVQLSALALYLKAKDLGLEGTPQMHLVIADCVLQRGADYQALLDIYKGDGPATEAIEAIWSALEHVRDLGSLVRIEEEVEAAVQLARRRSAGSFSELTDWAAYKSELVARLKSAFAAEASSRDERQRVFGTEAEKGLDLFELLSVRYDVVCTNPPYMGSANMGATLRQYVDNRYPLGRRDLFAAFIERGVWLLGDDGYLAMVTQQSWMFLRSYSELRFRSSDKPSAVSRGPLSKGVLGSTALNCLAHLGVGAFREVSGEVVNVALFTLRTIVPPAHHRFSAFRLTSGASATSKAERLVRAAQSTSDPSRFALEQALLSGIPLAPIAYWIPEAIAVLLAGKNVADVADVVQGLATANDARWVRYWFEVSDFGRWRAHEKGGGYGKWCGHQWWVIDWRGTGSAVKSDPASVIRNPSYYDRQGWVYSFMAGGCLGLRRSVGSVFAGGAACGVFPHDHGYPVAALIGNRFGSLVTRLISGKVQLNESYVARIPVPAAIPAGLEAAQEAAVGLKARLVRSDMIERSFGERGALGTGSHLLSVAAVLCALESWMESEVVAGLGLD